MSIWDSLYAGDEVELDLSTPAAAPAVPVPLPTITANKQQKPLQPEPEPEPSLSLEPEPDAVPLGKQQMRNMLRASVSYWNSTEVSPSAREEWFAVKGTWSKPAKAKGQIDCPLDLLGVPMAVKTASERRAQELKDAELAIELSNQVRHWHKPLAGGASLIVLNRAAATASGCSR